MLLLQFKEGGYVLEDLGSTNGTKINGLTLDGRRDPLRWR